MNDAHLRVYMNDHIAGAVVALTLIRRCAGSNMGTPLGAFLVELTQEIEEDLETLRGLHRRVGGVENPVKKAGAWAAVKMGGLKLNNELTRYSDLSRLEELEGLLIGVRGKMALWDSLAAAADDRFADVDFQALRERAQRQHDRLDAFHRDAARVALAPLGERPA